MIVNQKEMKRNSRICFLLLFLFIFLFPGCQKKEEDMTWQIRAEHFLQDYLKELEDISLKLTTSYWQAANSGAKEDFDSYAAADLEFKKLHSNKDRFIEIGKLLKNKNQLQQLAARSLEIANLAFKGNQLPNDILEKLVKAGAEIEQIFSTFRGKLNNREFSNNELLDRLDKEKIVSERQQIWETLKQVGEAVGKKLVALAKIRNEAAKMLGYDNYWVMRIHLQEHDPEQLMSIFSELERLTDLPYKKMKLKIDHELAKRFGVSVNDLMPWHYNNPFFQAAPPAEKINLDEFYRHKKKEQIIEIAEKFYSDIGLPVNDILEHSDLYERKGKDQHAFCLDIDRHGDVRILLNVKPTAEWMDTALHEMGHAVYGKFLNFDLPFILRDPAHSFTTEAVAMLFGALAKNPIWIQSYAEADKDRIEKIAHNILEQRQREQLIFARWSMVMFYFEKSLYENPDQNLNKLWWDLKERFQFLKRPENRDAADWAAKPHFTIAPVYYHNYQLGELLAAQYRHKLAQLIGHQGSTSMMKLGGNKQIGNFFKKKVFQPGMTSSWPIFVKESTGEQLSAKYFASEVK